MEKLTLFAHGGSTQYLPPDLQSSYELFPKMQPMINDEPGLAGVFLSVKYAPWKEALYKAWVSIQPKYKFKGKLFKQPMETQARLTLQVLRETAREISRNPVPATWPSNANRYRNREQGPATTMRNLGVVGLLYTKPDEQFSI